MSVACSQSGKAAAATGILTCADDGTFAVKLDLDTSRLYVEGDHSHFSNLAGFAGTYPGVRMDLSAECSERTIYKSFFLDYSDIGKPVMILARYFCALFRKKYTRRSEGKERKTTTNSACLTRDPTPRTIRSPTN